MLFWGRARQAGTGAGLCPVPASAGVSAGAWVFTWVSCIGLRHGRRDSAKPAAILFVKGHEIGVNAGTSLAAVELGIITPRTMGITLVRHFVLRQSQIGTEISPSCCAPSHWKPLCFQRQDSSLMFPRNRRKSAIFMQLPAPGWH